MNEFKISEKYSNKVVDLLSELEKFITDAKYIIGSSNAIADGEANAELSALIYELPVFLKQLEEIDDDWNADLDDAIFN